MPAPLYARLLHRALATTHRLLDITQRTLSEIPVLLNDPALERAALDAHYASAARYQSRRYNLRGLYPFEARALAAHFPPTPARLFVCGAGGGREVLALLQRGYTVDACEPVRRLVELANQNIGGSYPTRVACASVEEWAEQASGEYDGIFTGWGMWGHILRHDDRIRVLRAFRRVCPRGPVLLSFWRSEAVFDPEEYPTNPEPLFPPPENRIHAVTRGLLNDTVFRRPQLERGSRWIRGLYAHLVSETELLEEAPAGGYELVSYERNGSIYPNAVLRPI